MVWARQAGAGEWAISVYIPFNLTISYILYLLYLLYLLWFRKKEERKKRKKERSVKASVKPWRQKPKVPVEKGVYRFWEFRFFAFTASRCLHAPFTPCIARDARRICRLSVIFRCLLRPEVMVIYTRVSYMDFLRNRATLAGGDTREKRNIRDLANHAKPSKSAKRQASPPRQNLKTSKSR